MDNNETKQKEEMSIQPNEVILSKLIKQDVQNESDTIDNETQYMDNLADLK